jgi:hypothetical protein
LFLIPTLSIPIAGVLMLTKPSLANSNEFIEAELSQDEEHILQLLEDMKRDVIWVNRTQMGIVPGALDTLKMYYSDLEAFHILESLVRKGMLDRIDNGILLLCPKCGSHESSILKSCPSCGSNKLRKKNKIVHSPCEHWGTFDEFKGGNTITCPVCKEEIESDKIFENTAGFSYSDPYYECQECRFSSNRVQTIFLCNSCKTQYKESDAVELEQTGFMVAVETIKHQDRPVKAPTPKKVPEPDNSPPPQKEKRSISLLDELAKLQNKRKNQSDEKPKTKKTPTQEEIEQELIEDKPSEMIIVAKSVTRTETFMEVPESVDHQPESVDVIKEEPDEILAKQDARDTINEKKIEVIEPIVEDQEEVTDENTIEDETEIIIQEEKPKDNKAPVEEAKTEQIIETPIKKIVEKVPEKDLGSKVLFVVEDQMMCNFVLDELQKSGIEMELNLVEDGSQALKSLRRIYDMIIIDCKLGSVDPKFVLNEMSKWKIKTPLIIIDDKTLGVIPKELNVISVIKRNQRDIHKIRKIVSKHIK